MLYKNDVFARVAFEVESQKHRRQVIQRPEDIFDKSFTLHQRILFSFV